MSTIHLSTTHNLAGGGVVRGLQIILSSMLTLHSIEGLANEALPKVCFKKPLARRIRRKRQRIRAPEIVRSSSSLHQSQQHTQRYEHRHTSSAISRSNSRSSSGSNCETMRSRTSGEISMPVSGTGTVTVSVCRSTKSRLPCDDTTCQNSRSCHA